MATGGRPDDDSSTIVDQDQNQLEEESKVENILDDDDPDKDRGVGRPIGKKESKRNSPAGILRIDTSAGYNSRRKSSTSSVGDFRSGASYLNPQVSFNSCILLFSIHISNQKNRLNKQVSRQCRIMQTKFVTLMLFRLLLSFE